MKMEEVFNLEVKIAKETWKCRSYAYLAKRGEKLFVNILIEDVNSTHEDFKHNFILNRCVVTNKEVDINYSEFNNSYNVGLTENLVELVSIYAREIYKTYFK